MRLFLAIDIPEGVKNSLIALQKQLRQHIRAKYVEPENLHVTLKFLGEVPDTTVLDPLRQLEFKPFRASLSHIGAFPNPNYIRVLWVGIKQGADEVIRLHDLIESKIPFGRDKDYHPHITIARVKSRVDDKSRSLLSAGLDDGFEVNGFSLYKSTLTPSGPVYERISVYPSQP